MLESSRRVRRARPPVVRRELMPEAGAPARRGARRPDHVLAEGLHPADDAVPRPLRLLHVRQAAGPARRRRTSTLDDVLGDRAARARRSAATRRCSRSARRPRTRYPAPREWLAAHGYASTVDYLVDAAAAVLEETGLLPHANAGALAEAELDAAPGRQPVAGDDDRDARRPPRASPAARTTARPTRRPSAASPRSRPRAGPRIPFTTGILVGIGETRAERHRRAASRSATRTHATVTCRK